MLTSRDKKIADELKEVTGRLSEDLIYRLVLDEIERQDFDPIAKVQALGEAEGDEIKANALYAKHRVRRIHDFMKAIALEAETERLKLEKDTRTKLHEDNQNKLVKSAGDLIYAILCLIVIGLLGLCGVGCLILAVYSLVEESDVAGVIVGFIGFFIFLFGALLGYRRFLEI